MSATQAQIEYFKDDERRVIIAKLLGKRIWTSDDLRLVMTVEEVARKLIA